MDGAARLVHRPIPAHDHDLARRRSPDDGELVLLADQDRARWDAVAIAQGRRLVDRAARLGPPGPYVLQAAIVATH